MARVGAVDRAAVEARGDVAALRTPVVATGYGWATAGGHCRPKSTQIPYALGWSAAVMSLPFISGLHLASRDFPATSFSPS